MMTPQQLKNSILQRAIEGKLVEQRPEEGTAKELLKQIKAEKDKRIKEGKIKKTKPLPPITEDEIPFEIPESWEWIRLGEITIMINGDRGKNYPKKDEYVTNGIAWINTGHIMPNGYLSTEQMNFITEAKYNILGNGKIQNGDLLYCLRGATFGKVSRIEPYSKGAIASSLMIIRPINIAMREYIFGYLTTPLAKTELRKYDNGSAQPNLAAKDVSNYLIPLPPLLEQHRIVAKIEELLPFVDEYDKAYSQLTALNKKFPADMKKSILQYAIEGKLVEQRPEEGTAADLLKQIKAEKAKLIKEGKIKKEKPLPSITEDEIPFEVPESWEWVRLADISTKLVDGEHNPPKGVSEKTEYIMASSTNINYDGLFDLENVRYLSKELFDKENERTKAEKGDIFFTSVGSLGRSCVYEGGLNICFQRSVSVIKTLTYNVYLKYVFDSAYYQNKVKKEATGTAQKGYYLRQLSNSLIPVPPLAEQKRIVERIEKLLPLCDKLL